MSRRRRITALSLAIGLILIAAGLYFLPRLVGSLPGQLQGRLPEKVLMMVSTPFPTALPAPLATPVEITDLTSSPSIATSEPTRTPPPTTMVSATIVVSMNKSPVNERREATMTPVPTLAPESLPLSVIIEGLEVIPQKFNNCGPANLTVLLNFFGHVTDQLDVAAVVKPNYDDRNVSPGELAEYVNENTLLRAASYSGGDLNLLKRLIAAGYPVIIEKGLEPSSWQGWMGHYLTVIGYDSPKREFYSIDTFLGPWDNSGRIDSFADIDNYWSHFNYSFLVVYPSYREQRVGEILGPRFSSAMAAQETSLTAARAAITESPENAFAWFNLGQSLTRLGELTDEPALVVEAAAAFDKARQIGLPWRMLWYQFEPYEAYLAAGRPEEVLALAAATLSSPGGRNVEETYLYRGHALLAEGDSAGAERDYRNALRLNPNFEKAREAIAVLSGRA